MIWFWLWLLQPDESQPNQEVLFYICTSLYPTNNPIIGIHTDGVLYVRAFVNNNGIAPPPLRPNLVFRRCSLVGWCGRVGCN